MKKIISLIMAFALLLTLCPAAFAASNAQISVTADKTTVAPGEDVVFTVKVSNPTGKTVYSAGFKLDIPADLEFKSSVIDCASQFTVASYNDEKANFGAYGATNGIASTEWTVMTLTYTVKASASVGSKVISVIDEDTYLALGDENDSAIGVTPGAAATVNVTIPDSAYEAQIGSTKYLTLAEAVDAVATELYPTTPGTATTITLLKDVSSGFDVGVEKYPYATEFRTQNIVLDLNNNTLTVGYPPVGSGGTKTTGIRVLAYSKLAVKNGTIAVGEDTDVKRVFSNYGDLTLENVEVQSGALVDYTINNRGVLNLVGDTSVVNGGLAGGVAIANSAYDYPEECDINSELNVSSENVEVGDVLVLLNKVVCAANGNENAGVPEVNVSAGSFGKISTSGDYKEPVGNITGGTFTAAVPEDLCAENYAPVSNGNGIFGVEADFEAQIGDTKYATLEEAVDAATEGQYPNEVATATTITLLKDVTSGFDVGVEKYPLDTNFKTQNIVLDLNEHTLTLGDPLVGSSNTKTNGIRVLAFSQLVIKNGTIDTTETGVKRGIQNYGKVTVEDVTFINGDAMLDTIGNFGTLTLLGETVVPNGSNSAILNSTYQHEEEHQIPVVLNIAENTVEVGKIIVDLNEYAHPTLGDINKADPIINISAGIIEGIETEGETKTVVNGVSGGVFSVPVPENICAEGFEPAVLGNGKYGVQEETITPVYPPYTPSIPSTPSEPPVPTEPVNPFVDVSKNAYYYDVVLWAVENEITTGTSTTTFSPNAVCTRAQVVTFLWRAAGSPEPVSTVMPFSDVAANEYYYDAVLWAVENGITNGTSATTFSPDADCTRGQIVTFLWRSQGSEDASAYNPFVDVVNDAYYTEAVLWAVANDITNGTSATTFSPDADCTRAQIVTFLWRCLTK